MHYLKSPHRTLDTAVPDLKSLGYDGIEIPLKSILHFGKDKFKTLMADNNMEVVVMVIKFCLSLFFSLSLCLSASVCPACSACLPD
jgi:sugar phosphate isomerase/epimerase